MHTVCTQSRYGSLSMDIAVSISPQLSPPLLLHCWALVSPLRAYQDLVVQATARNKVHKYSLNVPSLRNFLPSFDVPTTDYKSWVHSVSAYNSIVKEWGFVERDWLSELPIYPAFDAAIGGLGELVSLLWLTKGC